MTAGAALDLRQRVFRMLRDYVPEEPYPGQLVLLGVANRRAPGTFRVPVEGWQKIGARPVEAFLVSGDHMSMIREPHAGAVAEHLRRLVDAHPPRAAFAVTWDTPEEAERTFKGLSDGATIQMPLDKTFFAKKFGMLVDKFGTHWMVICENPM